jgi:hypothetical protein
MGNILLPSHFNNYEYKTSKEIRLDSKKYIFKTINLVKIIKLYVYMVFESLGFLWVPSLDIDESFRYYSKDELMRIIIIIVILKNIKLHKIGQLISNEKLKFS